jgi:hypothetical protein
MLQEFKKLRNTQEISQNTEKGLAGVKRERLVGTETSLFPSDVGLVTHSNSLTMS